jgi:hypothetical protein
MPYRQRLNTSQSLSTQDAIQLNAEMDALRAELDDIRTKYTALRALLAAATAPGAAYNTGTGLAAATFTPT